MTKKRTALLALLATALASALAYHAWASGLLMGREREAVAVAFVAYDGPRGLLICLENTGEVPLRLEELYVIGPGGATLACFDGHVFFMHPLLPEDLDPGERALFRVEWEEPHGLGPGDEVLVRAITARGNVFEAEVAVR